MDYIFVCPASRLQLNGGSILATVEKGGFSGTGTDEQPSPATLSSSRAPNQELASDPLACRPALNFLPEASFGVRKGGWILGVDIWGIFVKMHGSAVWLLLKKKKNSLKIRTHNPHTLLNNPPQNPRPRSAPKIRTQNPQPKSAPKLSTNTHRARNEQATRGVP